MTTSSNHFGRLRLVEPRLREIAIGGLPRLGVSQQLQQFRHIGRNAARLNSDTSHIAGDSHTEEKYEHTNRSCNQKTPARDPRLRSGLGNGGGGDGLCAFSRLMVAQTERLYLSFHSQAA